MNRDDIIRMAREAGLHEDDGVWYSRSDVDADVAIDDLERFASLVAARERKSMQANGWRRCAQGQRTTQHCAMLEAAVLAEREACALHLEGLSLAHPGRADLTLTQCIAAIRARGKG